MSMVEASSYCEYVGNALQERQRELSLRWLERLVALLPVDANAVFTSNELLDHIPRLIEEIGKYVAAPEVADIAANTVVTEHARELGQLRHRQQASVHQVLREYDLLGEVLEKFLDECTSALPAYAGRQRMSRSVSPYRPSRARPDADDGGHVSQRVHGHHYRSKRRGSSSSTGRSATNCAMCSARRCSAQRC